MKLIPQKSLDSSFGVLLALLWCLQIQDLIRCLWKGIQTHIGMRQPLCSPFFACAMHFHEHVHWTQLCPQVWQVYVPATTFKPVTGPFNYMSGQCRYLWKDIAYTGCGWLPCHTSTHPCWTDLNAFHGFLNRAIHSSEAIVWVSLGGKRHSQST